MGLSIFRKDFWSNGNRIKRLYPVFAAVLSGLCLTACADMPSAEPETAETEETKLQENETFGDLRFTVHMDGGEEDIIFWGDGVSLYYYFLPSGAGTGSLTVGTKNGITLRRESEPEEARISFSDGDHLNGIACGETYLLGCHDQNDYLYEAPVVFMQGANVYSAFIKTESGSIQNVLDDKNYKEKGSMLIADPQGSVVYQGDLSYIKGRGNGSWWSFKKPFNIKLARSADLLGMGNARKWCLINMEQDFSLIRDKLSFDMAKAAGLRYSPDSEYIDLWIDGAYNGLYLLTDRIDISEASVDITDLEAATEAVNLDPLDTYPLSYTDNLAGNLGDRFYVQIPNDPANITGGYLLEVDKSYPLDKVTRFNTQEIRSVTLKSPEYATQAQTEYISDFISKMETALENPGSDAYKNYIDERSWAKMYVLNETLANHDFMDSSQYFYKDVDTGDGTSLLYAGPVWDMDLILGFKETSLPTNGLWALNKQWFSSLIHHQSFMDTTVDVYRNTFRPLEKELLEEGIDRYLEITEVSARMNYIRWPMVVPEGTGGSRDGAADVMKKYLSERLDFLDDLWLNGTVYHTVRVTNGKTVLSDENGYYFIYYMVPDGEPMGEIGRINVVPALENAKEGYIFKGWYYGTPNNLGEPFDPQAPVTKDTTVCALYEPL